MGGVEGTSCAKFPGCGKKEVEEIGCGQGRTVSSRV